MPPVAWRFASESRTGAAANRLGVNTAAAGTAPSTAATSAKSWRPEALIPALVPAAANPSGIRAARVTAGRSAGSGARSGSVARGTGGPFVLG